MIIDSIIHGTDRAPRRGDQAAGRAPSTVTAAPEMPTSRLAHPAGRTSPGLKARTTASSGPRVQPGTPGGPLPASAGARAAGAADARPVSHPTILPYWAKNRVQRVRDRACSACGGPVLRARRGPAPTHCVECALGLRRLQQLRAYLRSAERLARDLGRPAVGDALHDALVLLDGGREPCGR
jgi:hypothetical protein